MKIAFITDGKSPVPATKGGAVEKLKSTRINLVLLNMILLSY